MIYAPSNNLLEGIRNLFPLEICPWDDYYPRMAQTDFLGHRHELLSSKTYFIRKAPFGGSYAVLGGLTAFLRMLNDFSFDSTVCGALLDMGYRKEFVDYLKNSHPRILVDVYSIPEGGLFFPNEPAIVMEGTLLDIRFAEGLLLKYVNFPSLSFTKWSRVVQAIEQGLGMEFSRRRAQNDIVSSVYAHLGGATFSSNAEVRRGLNIKIVGTMGHEYIQSHGDEFEAFDTWLEYNPDRPVLLGDTRNTIKSGIPNAIKAFEKHKERILNAGGIPGFRLDSGDLAYLTIECRREFDKAGLNSVNIFETNDLDEYTIESIREQIFSHAPKAGLDPVDVLKKCIWACGTQPGNCSDQPSLGGVAKLTSIENNDHLCEVIKLATDNPIKTSIPGNNRSSWVWNRDTNQIVTCLIHPKDENPEDCRVAIHPDDELKSVYIGKQHLIIPRQQLVYSCAEGNLTRYLKMTHDTDTGYIRGFHKTELGMLHWTEKRFVNPHMIKVSLSVKLFNLRRRMIKEGLLINLE
jgi:nicotinate phosphoribosyltransferase